MIYVIILTLLFTPLATYPVERPGLKAPEADAKLSDHDQRRLRWLNRFTLFSENNKRFPSESLAKLPSLLVMWRKCTKPVQNTLDNFFKRLEKLTPYTQLSLPGKKPLPLEHPLDHDALDIILNAFIIGEDPQLNLINLVRKAAGVDECNSRGLAYQLFIRDARTFLAGAVFAFPHLDKLGINVIILPLTKERTFDQFEQTWIFNPSSYSRIASVERIKDYANEFLGIVNSYDETSVDGTSTEASS